MRAINIGAALSGALALVMLVLVSHAFRETMPAIDLERIRIAAYLQLFSGCAGLALAARTGKLNAIGAGLILGGAFIFAAALYALALTGQGFVAMAAPVGGLAMIAGWVVIGFAKP